VENNPRLFTIRTDKTWDRQRLHTQRLKL